MRPGWTFTRPRRFTAVAFSCAGAAAFAASACVAVDGGAVEVSWVVRSADGQAINECGCADPRIDRVRVTLVGADGSPVAGQRPCDGRAACTFPCQRQTGATPFDIPPGRYLISLAPLDAEGRDLTCGAAQADCVRVVSPIARDVVDAQPTQLPAILLTAECAASCSSASHVCTSNP